MKNKVIIGMVGFLLIITVLIVGSIIFVTRNNIKITTITLDINPSIEIKIDQNKKVKKIIALNDDGKDIIDNSLKGKKLKEAFDYIADKVVKKDYMDDNRVFMILYTKGYINNLEIKNELEKSFKEINVATEITEINAITQSDKELAKKQNISISKAAYINSIKKESNIDVENLKDKSITELKETEMTGNYCDKGYKLEGTNCVKEISREKAVKGNICPSGYNEYKGKCYAETAIIETNKLVCRGEFKLVNNKCIHERIERSIPTKYSCSSGELMKRSEVGLHSTGKEDSEYICVDKANLSKPKLRCLTINHIMIDGQCYVGPAPTINGGCPNNDKLVNGGCYSKDDGDQWICPSGNIYEKSKETVPTYCATKYTNAKVSEYRCENSNAVLRNDKCVITEEEDAQHERTCPSGYNLVNNSNCINYNKTANKENGYICNKESTRLENDECITYEMIEAKHN